MLKENSLCLEERPIASPPPGYEGIPSRNMCYEVCPEAESLLSTLLPHLKHATGAALFLDYGYTHGNGDTLQALFKHHYVSPFENPGHHDLTAHVNFGRLRSLIPANFSITLSTQQDFLMSLGILIRTKRLMQSKTSEQQAQIWQATQRLIDPTQMGILFKVLEMRAP